MYQPVYQVVGVRGDGVRVVASQGISLRRARHVRDLLRWDRVFAEVLIEHEPTMPLSESVRSMKPLA